MPLYPTFLDIEATGLIIDSYPIEIAWNAPNGELTSFLIKPHKEWTYWSETAEKLHRISRNELEQDGISLKQACAQLNDAFSGGHIFSDAPDFERHWLDRLYDTARMKRPFAIKNISEIPRIKNAQSAPMINSLYEQSLKQAFTELGDRHRAAVDVKAMMRAYDLCEESED